MLLGGAPEELLGAHLAPDRRRGEEHRERAVRVREASKRTRGKPIASRRGERFEAQELLDQVELAACIEGTGLPQREKIIIPRYSEKAAKAKEKRKTSIFQPRPREVPTGS